MDFKEIHLCVELPGRALVEIAPRTLANGEVLPGFSLPGTNPERVRVRVADFDAARECCLFAALALANRGHVGWTTRDGSGERGWMLSITDSQHRELLEALEQIRGVGHTAPVVRRTVEEQFTKVVRGAKFRNGVLEGEAVEILGIDGMVAFALAHLVSRQGDALSRRLGRCPHCGAFFLPERKRKYCCSAHRNASGVARSKYRRKGRATRDIPNPLEYWLLKGLGRGYIVSNGRRLPVPDQQTRQIVTTINSFGRPVPVDEVCKSIAKERAQRWCKEDKLLARMMGLAKAGILDGDKNNGFTVAEHVSPPHATAFEATQRRLLAPDFLPRD